MNSERAFELIQRKRERAQWYLRREPMVKEGLGRSIT
jgi:hypothetical protein